MNERMEQEMNRTIQMLRASMPRKTGRAGMRVLLRLSAEEMNGALLLALFGATILLGVTAARLLSQPMLTAFYTAPLPGLLLSCRYVLYGNERMRELEDTFRYSYTEMLVGRTAVISLYMLSVQICLAFVLHNANGADFLRLALCGAVPSIYLCAFLLLLSSMIRQQKTGSAIAVALWMVLAFLAACFPVEQFLQSLQMAVYGIAAVIGLIFYGASVWRTTTAGDLYVVNQG